MRRIDFISSGIDGILGGFPLFADVTIVSPLRGTGRPMPRSSREDGAAVRRAEIRNREVDYPDIEATSSAVLLSLGCETYGRWSSHSLNLIRQLCQYRAKNAPIYLQNSLRVSMFARWWGLLSYPLVSKPWSGKRFSNWRGMIYRRPRLILLSLQSRI